MRWSENVVRQYFSGLEFYAPKPPCDATQVGRFRKAIGEAGVEELLKATIDAAVEMKAVRPAECERVIVDTTVQEKAIAHPVDSRLLEIARDKVVRAAKSAGIALKQTFAKEGKELRRKAGGYAHAKQFRRLKRVLKRQRTILGIVLRTCLCSSEQHRQEDQMDELQAGVVPAFAVFPQAAVFLQPSKAAFDHPALGYHSELVQLAMLGDPHRNRLAQGLPYALGKGFAHIAAVGQHALHFTCSAPLRSVTPSVVTAMACGSPCVSTAMWRLMPDILLPAS